jgi:outer membrane protein
MIIIAIMKRRVFLSAAVFLSISFGVNAQATGGKTYSLRQCIESGISNNLVVRQSGLQVETSEINWKQAKLNLLPDLNGSVGHGINQGRSIDPFTNSYINQQIN